MMILVYNAFVAAASAARFFSLAFAYKWECISEGDNMTESCGLISTLTPCYLSLHCLARIQHIIVHRTHCTVMSRHSLQYYWPWLSIKQSNDGDGGLNEMTAETNPIYQIESIKANQNNVACITQRCITTLHNITQQTLTQPHPARHTWLNVIDCQLWAGKRGAWSSSESASCTTGLLN